MEVTVGVKAAKRLEIVLRVEKGMLSCAEGAKRLGVTERQLRRIRERYGTEGIGGLVSKRQGLPAKHRIAESVKSTVSALVVKHYQGFGPTLVQEKLCEQHAIDVSIESVRHLMILEGRGRPSEAKKWYCIHCGSAAPAIAG